MGRVVAIANQKGGVGKTTTAINLAVALADAKWRVLLIDLDPQGNATSGLDSRREPTKSPSPRSIYHALIGHASLTDVVRPVRELLSLAASSVDLVGAEIELATMEGREGRLRVLLDSAEKQYNIVLIDTPPSLGLLTLNALVAADSVLVPMQCEYYALEGLSALLGTIERVKAALNSSLKIEGLVLTMFDARNRLSREVEREVREHFPDRIFNTIIPRNVRLSESPSHGLSVFEYDGRSSGAQSYRQLAAELMAREDARIASVLGPGNTGNKVGRSEESSADANPAQSVSLTDRGRGWLSRTAAAFGRRRTGDEG